MKGLNTGVVLRGMAMGAADIVPGVSGGTVAFITGIYDQLIESIKACNIEALRLLFRDGPVALWQHINGGFLASLLLGIVISVVSLARGISWALETQPLLLAAFFFGLILASALLVYRQIPAAGRRSVFLLSGLVFALLIAQLRPAQLEVSLLSVYGAGALAICAMILPGISGSFILLLLGMYAPVIHAIEVMDVTTIAVFILGCASGLMLFVRLLSYLMHRHRPALLATLTGILLGSLAIIWPWKLSAEGHLLTPEQAVSGRNVWPADYAAQADPQWLLCLGLMFIGFVVVLLLERIAGRS